MNNKKVCHISSVHSLYDTRIMYRECKTLVESGFEVYLIIPHIKDEEIMGIKIKALKKAKNRFLRFFITDFSALIKAIKIKANIYHFHDPELIFAGIILRLFGKKVIYDVHEDLPSQVLYKNWLKFKIIKKIISSLVLIIHKIASLVFNQIITVESEIAKSFRKNKTTVLRNLPLVDYIEKIEKAKINKDKIILIYAGGLTRVRGIKEIILALEKVKTPVVLYLAGSWESEKYMNECRELKSWQYVEYKGFIPPEEVYSLMKVADIGLAMLYPEKNHIKALPIKIFEYAACGIPQIISDFFSSRELFKEFAIFANPLAPEDIAEKINFLIENKNIYHNLKSKTIKTIKNNFSWGSEKKILIDLYNNL